MAESSATIGELEREYATALSKDDKPMAVSAINSILYKLKPEFKAKRLQYLNKKHELLTELKCMKLADEVVGLIL